MNDLVEFLEEKIHEVVTTMVRNNSFHGTDSTLLRELLSLRSTIVEIVDTEEKNSLITPVPGVQETFISSGSQDSTVPQFFKTEPIDWDSGLEDPAVTFRYIDSNGVDVEADNITDLLDMVLDAINANNSNEQS